MTYCTGIVGIQSSGVLSAGLLWLEVRMMLGTGMRRTDYARAVVNETEQLLVFADNFFVRERISNYKAWDVVSQELEELNQGLFSCLQGLYFSYAELAPLPDKSD